MCLFCSSPAKKVLGRELESVGRDICRLRGVELVCRSVHWQAPGHSQEMSGTRCWAVLNALLISEKRVAGQCAPGMGMLRCHCFYCCCCRYSRYTDVCPSLLLLLLLPVYKMAKEPLVIGPRTHICTWPLLRKRARLCMPRLCAGPQDADPSSHLSQLHPVPALHWCKQLSFLLHQIKNPSNPGANMHAGVVQPAPSQE